MKAQIRVDAHADFSFNHQEIIWLRSMCASVLHGPSQAGYLPEYIKFVQELYDELNKAPS